MRQLWTNAKTQQTRHSKAIVKMHGGRLNSLQGLGKTCGSLNSLQGLGKASRGHVRPQGGGKGGSRPLGLSETIRLTTNEFALSRRALETREADTMCVETEPNDEEEDTPLVRQAIEVRKSVYGSCSEGLAGALRKTAKGKLDAYIKRINEELAEKSGQKQVVAEEKKALCI